MLENEAALCKNSVKKKKKKKKKRRWRKSRFRRFPYITLVMFSSYFVSVLGTEALEYHS